MHRAIAAACAALALAPLAAISLAAPSASAATRTAPAGHQHRDRGALISATRIARLSRATVAAELRSARNTPGSPALGAGMVRYGIVAYRVTYRTVNEAGRPVRASGLVAFPAAGPRRLRLVSYAHGTTTYKPDVPSSFGLDAAGDGTQGRLSSELFASTGLAVAEPDYVGMGIGAGRPEYMVAASEASASADLLTAARTLAAHRGDRLDRGVLATGFSQGGAAAMALGRVLQGPRGRADTYFRLSALAPISGPYALAAAELPGVFNGHVAPAVASYYIGYTLTAWNPIYHLYTTQGQAFRAPYAARVAGLFDGSHTNQQVIAGLPPTLNRLLTPRYLHLMRHPSRYFRSVLDRNSTCAGWTPRVPVRLYAGGGDHQVPPANAIDCLHALRARQASVRLVRVGRVGHDESAFLALPRIVRWFAGR